MTLTAAEQYVLELMNRARLDPLAEAARLGIDLNDGLAPGTLRGGSRQVLAPNALLETSATNHSLWMFANDTYSHTGVNGSDAGERMTDAGYIWNAWGENLDFYGHTRLAVVFDEATAELMANDLFESAVHRENLLDGTYREVGIGAETDQITLGGTTYNAALLTENFGLSGANRYLTGVAYTDTDEDDFYSVGEGVAGVVFTVGTQTGTTQAAGGYAVSAGSRAVTQVTGTSGDLSFSFKIDMSKGNVKVDLVDDALFHSSGSIALGTGVNDVELLGTGNLKATGNMAGNLMIGNSGGNVLTGLGGNDSMDGGAGADVFYGGGGHDVIFGGAGSDILRGGLGSDTLVGETGRDILTGNLGRDHFVFEGDFGRDRVTDFRRGQGDRLEFDHSLWTGTKTAADVVASFAHIGTNEVYFDFGDGNQVHLAGLTTLNGLANTLIIF